MQTIGTFRRANLERLIADVGTADAVAAAVGSSPVYVSQLRNASPDSETGRPREMGSQFARRLEQAFNKPAGWMDQPPHDSPVIQEEPPRSWGTSQEPVQLLAPRATPRLVWGEAMPAALPATFAVAIPDDSMAPRVKRGDVVRFQTGLTPSPGDGVLVRDAAGRWFFRQYRERRPGEWEAHPINAAYQPLDGSREDLRILGVLVGIEEQRWA